MKNFIVIFFVLTCLTSVAKSPFEGVSSKTLKNPTLDKCTSNVILYDAMNSTGINILDRPIKKIWTCKSADSDKCPKVGTSCYSNSNSGFPAICIESPETVEIGFENKKIQDRKDKRTRFSSLHILNKNIESKRSVTSWKMGGDGCHAEEVSLQGEDISLDSCLKDFDSLLNGGLIFGSDDSSMSKYCGLKKSNNKPSFVNVSLYKIKKIAKCNKYYPHLREEYSKSYLSRTNDRKIKKSNSSSGI